MKSKEDQVPLISIIIPTYNSDKALKITLESIISQLNSNTEIIIIDGKSTDKTIQIIKEYEHYITYCESNKDNGVYDAMNKGIKASSGRFLYFLGADDTLLPNALERITPYLTKTNVIYYGNAFFPKRGIIYDGEFNSYKIVIRNICHQAIFYPREVFERHTFNKKYKILADYALNLELWGDKNYKFKYLPQTIAVFNDYSGISKTNVDINFENDKFELIKNYFNLSIIFYMRLRKIAANFFNNLFKKR